MISSEHWERIVRMKRIVILFVLLFVCVGCDQSTKYTARHFLEGRSSLSYLKDSLRLTYTENSGAFLSLGANWPHHIRRGLFVVFTSIFLAGFFLIVLRNQRFGTAMTSACALILGGGVGNLIDRVVNQGAVIDFINVGIGPVRTGIFNVADLAITAGLLMLFIVQFTGPNRQKSAGGGEDEI